MILSPFRKVTVHTITLTSPTPPARYWSPSSPSRPDVEPQTTTDGGGDRGAEASAQEDADGDGEGGETWEKTSFVNTGYDNVTKVYNKSDSFLAL